MEERVTRIIIGHQG